VQAEFDIRRAAASDLVVARKWLAAAGLPTADLTVAHMGAFLLASADGRPVGMIGLEGYAETGLLRSLIVDHECRRKGLGAQLVTALESKAAAAGMTELWLLTIDADPFFARLDYEVMQRADAPTEIQNSAEFSSLCPGDAVLMRKRLQSD
jgi:amino-acid N-acetyltransferase